MRAIVLIFIAVTIDALQALVSAGLFILTTFSGTIAGGAAGCVAGNYVAGQLGCWAGGVVLGFFGSFADLPLAPLLTPIGVVLGFAINICLSMTLGAGLVLLLWHFGMLYPRYLWGGLAEIIPGIDCLPFWTVLVVVSLLRKRAEEAATGVAAAASSVGGSILAPGSLLAGATAGVIAVRQNNASAAMRSNPQIFSRLNSTVQQRQEAQEEPQRAARVVLQNVDGVRARPQKTVAALVAVLLLFGLVPTIHAQTITSQPDPVQYILAPEAPGPNQLVQIEVQGVGSFLGNATVTWQQNGKVVQSGVGLSTFTFTTGGVGTVTQIHVTISSTVIGTINHDFVFSPSVTNLVWEADTTVPQFYAGKALYSAGSRLTVVAFPTVLVQGVRVPNSKISFQWKQGDTLAPAQSGLGRNTFSFYGDQLQTGESVSVDTYVGSSKVGHAEIYIPASNPEILLYSRDPLRGELLDQALVGTVGLSGKELTLQAEPYFFANISKQKGLLSYTWMLNGQETTGPDTSQGLLTLRQTGAGTGAASVSVDIQNTDADKLVQAARQVLQIAFGQTSSVISSFFGL